MAETMSDAVLARLEALEAEVAALKAENARLTAARPSGPEPGIDAPGASAASTPEGRRASGAGILKRRGLLAGVAALMGVGLAKLARPEPVRAGVDGDVVLGGRSPAFGAVESFTQIVANVSGTPAFEVVNKGYAGFKTPVGAAIAGYTTGGTSPAFFARNESDGGIGYTALMVNGTGVASDATSGIGVNGSSTNGVGVQGVSTNNAGMYAVGPIGLFASGTGVAGVFGGSNGNGFGFWGNSVASAGIYGTSTTGPGVRAESTNSFGLHAKGPTWAGVFEGNVFVTGRVVALGGVGASATATTRATALAEDVGEATLANGKATVALAEDFAAAANGDYRVFLTELADLGGLYVARKGPKEFEVRSRGGNGQAAQDGRFDYRVVAKTAGANNPRQAPLAPPDLTTIKPAPPLPQPPKAPEPGASEERRER